MGTLYTISVTNMNKILKEKENIKRDNIYLITRSDKIADSVTKDGWNYCNLLAPSWELFKSTKHMKEKGKWNEKQFEEFYKPSFLNSLKNRASINKIIEICNKVESGEDIYLVCFCPTHVMCHRSIVADIISMKSKINVNHLDEF